MTDIPDSAATGLRFPSWRERWTAFPPTLKGVLLGCFSALCYSLTNGCLRQVAVRTDMDWAMWVATWKAMPTAVAGCCLMAVMLRRGQSIVPPRDILLSLVANGLLMQFCGNVPFQYALSRAGLALTVPLCFASLITVSAILGRIVLHDPIRSRTVAAMGLLMLAVVLLSQGTRAASAMSLMRWQDAALGAAAACASGIGFSISGIIVRRSLRRGVTVAVALGYSSAVALCPVLIAVANQGLGPLARVLDRGGYVALLSAGILNAMGFFAVSEAMRHLPVVRVNLINASQAALGGLMGVLLFHEVPTWWLVAGTLTTISSLVVLGTEEA